MRSPVFAVVALFGLLVASVFGLRPITRAGVQCPTAPVQRVVVRDCCGRLVSRAPRLGDRVFVQCRCAERKAAPQRALVAAPKFEVAPPAPFSFTMPTRARSAPATFVYAAPAADWRAAPPTRPPTSA